MDTAGTSFQAYTSIAEIVCPFRLIWCRGRETGTSSTTEGLKEQSLALLASNGGANPSPRIFEPGANDDHT